MAPERPARFATLQSAIRVFRLLIPLCAFALAAVVGLATRFDPFWYTACAAMGALLVTLFGELLLGAAQVLLKIESTSFRNHDLLLDAREAMQRHTKLLETVADTAPMSDVAKGIAYREQEREIIRRAFHETLIGADFEAAHFLADQLEKRHGYKQEADRLRTEIGRTYAESSQRLLEQASSRVDSLLASRDWEGARQAIEQLKSRFPNDPAAEKIAETWQQRRNDHKRRLLKDWDEAVQRNNIDGSIAVLRELDQFLTPNEAAALEESARGVFRAKLHNLGVQFSLAVHDGQWATALGIGKEIVTEFPNSRMAAEVREHLDALKVRASRHVVAVAGEPV